MFVIDSTGSMSEDIEAAKAVAKEIISHKREVPVNFILSTFSDPGMLASSPCGDRGHRTAYHDQLYHYYHSTPCRSFCLYRVSKKTLWKFNRLSCIIYVAKQFNFYIGRKNSYLTFQ